MTSSCLRRDVAEKQSPLSTPFNQRLPSISSAGEKPTLAGMGWIQGRRKYVKESRCLSSHILSNRRILIWLTCSLRSVRIAFARLLQWRSVYAATDIVPRLLQCLDFKEQEQRASKYYVLCGLSASLLLLLVIGGNQYTAAIVLQDGNHEMPSLISSLSFSLNGLVAFSGRVLYCKSSISRIFSEPCAP